MNLTAFSKEVMAITPAIHASFIRNLPPSLREGGITIPQMLILDMLLDDYECRMSDISKSLGVTKSAITAIMNRLIKTGLIRRARSQKDRRVVRAHLTPRGARLSNKIRNYKLRLVGLLFANITRKERMQYLVILRKIQKNINPGAEQKTHA